MNIENAKKWIAKLSEGLSHASPYCDMMSVHSSCKSPGCVVGWTVQLMPEIFDDQQNYFFSDAVSDLKTYLGYPSSSDWRECFNVDNGAFFSSRKPYDCTASRVPLSKVISKWTTFIEYMEKKQCQQPS
jgi:hypothetical protein